MKIAPYILTLISIVFFSCDRIKNKGIEIIHKTEQKIVSKSQYVVDKAFPQFDAYQSDTKYNKNRFREYLTPEITSDVKEIYCFGDFIGIDYKILFSFKCDSSTIERIIKEKGLELTKDSMDHGLESIDDFEWWNNEIIKTLRAYKKGEGNKDWQYLWYDKIHRKAYFEQYSL